MIVGALLDAGTELEAVRRELAKLDMSGYDIRADRIQRGGIEAVKFHVDTEDGSQPQRNLNDILEMIDAAALGGTVKERAGAIFTHLAQAEAKVHGTAIEKVHFHEVGAVDSIVDIVAACIAIDLLSIDMVHCSAIPLGSGTVSCAHGVLPVPAPATAELLVGVRTADSDLAGELTTPTAAAVLTTLAESFGPMPAMELSAVGYGAGDREDAGLPNLLRVFVGRCDEAGAADSVVELSANIDDCTGEVIGTAIQKLLEAGCADAWATPIFMKKSRPAWTLSALCLPRDVAAVEKIFFSETTTFGIRRRLCARSKLHREHETVETPYGPVRIKVGRRGRQTVTASPELADCLAAAQAHHVPVRQVIAAAGAIYDRSRRAP